MERTGDEGSIQLGQPAEILPPFFEASSFAATEHLQASTYKGVILRVDLEILSKLLVKRLFGSESSPKQSRPFLQVAMRT